MLRAGIPIMAALALSACGIVPRGDAPPAKPAPRAAQTVTPSPSVRQCLADLGRAGSRFSAVPDRYFGPGCATVNSVQLDRLAGDRGEFTLSNIGPLHCPTAQTFAAWARFGVDRAAQQILGSGLERIETMGSYSCRNVAGSNRRSAHSQAQAIDVSAFVLEDGRRISVLEDWSGGSSQQREFLRIVHRSACKRFGTVLGPDYNAAHRNHFHLERGEGSFCR